MFCSTSCEQKDESWPLSQNLREIRLESALSAAGVKWVRLLFLLFERSLPSGWVEPESAFLFSETFSFEVVGWLDFKGLEKEDSRCAFSWGEQFPLKKEVGAVELFFRMKKSVNYNSIISLYALKWRGKDRLVYRLCTPWPLDSYWNDTNWHLRY